MIAATPKITIAAIWERLADEHGTTVAYPTLRTYVSSRRPPMRTPGQDQLRPTRIRTTKTMPTATLPQRASVSPKIARPGQPITTGNFS